MIRRLVAPALLVLATCNETEQPTAPTSTAGARANAAAETKSETKSASEASPVQAVGAKTANEDPPGGLAGQVAQARDRLAETADWPTYQGDVQRTGRASKAPALKAPRIRWHAQVGIIGYLNSPLVLGSRVVVPSSGTSHNSPDSSDGLHALDLATGKVMWHARALLDANGATAVGDTVVFTADDGVIRAVDLADGHERWTLARTGAVYSTPLAIDGRVIVGDAAGHVIAIEADTGKLAWEHGLSGAIRGGLASDGTSIFAVSQGGDVAALSSDGRPRWQRAAVRPGFSGGTEAIEGYNAPVVDGTRLIVPFARDTYYETGPALHALSIADGSPVWQASPGASAASWGNLRSSPALSDGVLVWAEPYSGDIAALDTATGRVRWREEVGQCLFPQYGSPAIAGDVAYVPRQDGLLYAVEVETGKVRWAMDLGDVSRAGPGAGRRGSGCEWDQPGAAPLYAPPAIATDGTVVVGSGAGVVYALEDGGPLPGQ